LTPSQFQFISSYGSPLSDPLFASNSDINPRLPGGSIGKRINADASDDSTSVVKPDGDQLDEEDLDDILAPGYK
jgi:hypothetical protein